MYKSLIEVEKKRLSSGTPSNEAPLLHNEPPRGSFVKGRNIAALAAASLTSSEDSCEFGSTKYFLLCGVGGILSCGITHTMITPLDLVKCRLQVDSAKYKNLVNGFKVTVAEEGTKGLARGWAPTAIGYSMQGLCKFGFYEVFKFWYSDLLGEENAYVYRTWLYLAASASAEFIADVALSPAESAKVKIQTTAGYANTFRECVPKMMKEEGLNAFYKSLVPLWMRQIPYTMMKFACFEKTIELLYKHVVPKPREQCTKGEQLVVTFAAGYIAGVFCAVVSHPADTVVSKLNQNKEATAGQVLKELGPIGNELPGIRKRCGHSNLVGHKSNRGMLDGPQAPLEPVGKYEGSRPQKDGEMLDLKQGESEEANGGKEGQNSTEYSAPHSRHHSPTGNTGRQSRGQSPLGSRTLNSRARERDKEDYDSDDSREDTTSRETVIPIGGGGYWRVTSRPTSPGDSGMNDAVSETSSMPPRPKSRPDASAKYNNLSYWRARKLVFYKNGDPFFPGLEFRFKPGRDVGSLEAILDKLSLRLDLPHGARYIFSMDGERKTRLEELEDGSSYVVSSYKTFKNASYGKKNGTWSSGQATVAQTPGWSKASLSRKQSLVEAELPPPGGGKPSSGRVIRIVNNLDHTVQCRVLLNLRTTQPFEEVLEDLGQVLKMNGAKRMYTVSGQEVRSFSQLRNEFADVDTFYLASGHYRQYDRMYSPRRSRSRNAISDDLREPPSRSLSRGRSKSQSRVVYDTEAVRANDYTLLEVMKEEPIRVTIRGMKRTFYPPIHHAPQDNSPPDKRLALSWVYGYRGTDSRKNLWVLPSGELLYFVAAVAVLYDRDEDSQRHYIGHTEDIQCMELHPSREMVASGQRAGRNRKTQAHIRIWSTETLLTLYVFGMGEFDVGVSAVAFSQLNGGSYVLAVDGGRERILSVWQWQWGHLLGKVATLQDDLTGAVFHPLDDNLLITHGKGNLTFWIRRKDGFFERTDIIKPPSRTHVTSVQFEQDGDVVTADSDGFITIYSVDADGAYFVRMEFEAHNKGISCLIMLSEGTLLSGGEKDRKIIAWDSLQNYKKVTETKLLETFGGVRSIYPQRPGRNDGNIYVGTTRNNIVEGSLQRRFNQVVFGHGRQLWGLAVHPDDELFATAGHDKNIALWRRTKLIWTMQVQQECVSLTFHPFGSAIAAGSTEGHLVVLNAENGTLITTIRVCGSPLSCLSYNPAGDMIAIGSQNGSVYLYRVSRDGFSYKKSNKIRGNQALTQLDWSSDGSFLQTTTADYDLLFWDVKALIAEKSPVTMKDIKWYTQTCSVGFSVAGIWNNRYYPMTSMITTLNRSSAHDLLITGDADGYLRLFRYPCLSPKAEYTEEKVYSLQVACARFLYHDKNVVTVGGTDAALMLWEVIDE